MAYSESVAQRIRGILEDRSDVLEKHMFGGIAFMLRGNMCCGVVGEELMLRVGPSAYADALSQPHAREMDFTGRPLKGFVYVAPDGFSSDQGLRAWVSRAVGFPLSLPTK